MPTCGPSSSTKTHGRGPRPASPPSPPPPSAALALAFALAASVVVAAVPAFVWVVVPVLVLVLQVVVTCRQTIATVLPKCSVEGCSAFCPHHPKLDPLCRASPSRSTTRWPKVSRKACRLHIYDAHAGTQARSGEKRTKEKGRTNTKWQRKQRQGKKVQALSNCGGSYSAELASRRRPKNDVIP